MTELTPKLFAIEVPIEAEDVRIHNDPVGICLPSISYLKNSNFCIDKLPKGQWKIIGLIDKDGMDFSVSENFIPELILASKSGNLLDTKEKREQVVRSLLASKGQHWVNPLGERPNMADYDNQSLGYLDLAAWQAAENALIKGKLIIVEKL